MTTRRHNELRFTERRSPLRQAVGRVIKTGNAVVAHRDIRKFWAGANLYSDEESRRLYRRLLLHRFVGPRLAPLPLDAGRYWANYETASGLVPIAEGRSGGMGLDVPIFDLRPFGHEITARCRANGVLAYCLQKQYQLHRPGVDIHVQPGDVVIDGGAAWGDTALIFAEMAGADGRVVSVEAMGECLDLFRENMDLNPKLAAHVELVEAALWDRSDQTLTMSTAGPGSRVTDHGTVTAQTVTIDDIVTRLDLSRVDFIKMDIEGSEHQALLGAHRTLGSFKPRLAISAYHKPGDIVDLAEHVAALDLGYRFYLEHYADHGEETVLFATV